MNILVLSIISHVVEPSRGSKLCNTSRNLLVPESAVDRSAHLLDLPIDHARHELVASSTDGMLVTVMRTDRHAIYVAVV